MKQLRVVIAILGMIVMACVPVLSQDEEPNNDFSNASELPLNQTINGSFSNTTVLDTVDYYVVTLSQSGSVEIIASNTVQMDLELSVIREGQVLEVQDATTTQGVEIISNNNVDAGTYYIKVKSKQGVGTYSLVVNFTPHELVAVTFLVDMQNQTVSPNGVFLIGDFVSWDLQQAKKMTNLYSSLYSVDVYLPMGSTIEYKFMNGNADWGGAEVLTGLSCASPQSWNRYYSVEQQTQLPQVCFAECSACSSGANNVYVVVSQDRNTGFAPLTVNFEGHNYGENIVEWNWNFGDENSAQGKLVSHTFQTPGVYQVQLNVLDDKGNTGSDISYITVSERTNNLQANFLANAYEGPAPLKVSFFDESDGFISGYLWNFGDNNTSNEQNPQFTFQNPGTYSVELIVYDNTGNSSTISKDITVWEPQQLDPYCNIAKPINGNSAFFDFSKPSGYDGDNAYIWYSYTAQSPEKLVVDLCNTGNSLWKEVFDVYIDCSAANSPQVDVKYINDSTKTIILLDENETVYFKVLAYQDMGILEFNIPILHMPFQDGDMCGNALVAKQGTNNADLRRGVQWFSFTPTSAGTVNLQYSSLDDIEIMFGSNCSDLQGYANNTISLSANEKLYISINSSYIDTLFPWNIQFSAEGNETSTCSNPIILTQSESIVVNPINQEYFDGWYTYTATKAEVLEFITCDPTNPYGMLAVELLGSCNMHDYVSYDRDNCDAGEMVKYEISAGETVYIHLYGHSFSSKILQFIARDFIEGETCNTALVLGNSSLGGVYMSPTDLYTTYYTFVAENSGIVTISNCDFVQTLTNASHVFVTKGCTENSEILAYANSNCLENGFVTQFQVVQGEQYFIEMKTTPATNWKFEFDAEASLPQGMTCDNPIVLNESFTSVQPHGNIVWLEMEFDESGKVFLTSDLQVEASVLILTSCIPLTEAMQGDVPYVMTQTGLVFWPQANVKYKLLLIFHENAPVNPINLEYILTPGETMPPHVICNDAEVIQAGNQTTTTQLGVHWYQYTATKDVFIQLKDGNEQFNHNESFGAHVYESCSMGLDYDSYDNFMTNSYCTYYHNLYYIPNGTTVYIQLNSQLATQTFTWELVEYTTDKLGFVAASSIQDVAPAVINNDTKTITLTIAQTSNSQWVGFNFELEFGNQLFSVNNDEICSGFEISTSQPTTVLIKNIDHSQNELWTVNVQKATFFNDKADVLVFSDYSFKNVQIDNQSKKIFVELSYDSQSCIYPYIQVSGGASYTMSEFCFTQNQGSISFSVKAENNTTVMWTVEYSKQQAPLGSSCANPLVVQKGDSGVHFDEYESNKYVSYTATSSALVTVSTCAYPSVSPSLYNSDCFPMPIDPQTCNQGYKVEYFAQQGETIIIQVNRFDYYNSFDMILSITETPVQITSLEVFPDSVHVPVGEQYCFEVVVGPYEELVESLTVSIEGTSIQHLQESCFKVLDAGTSYIYFSTTDGSNISKKVVIYSTKPPVPLESISLPQSLTLEEMQFAYITPVFTPTNADNTTIDWYSTSENIVSVDQNGKITAVKEGSAYVFCHNSMYQIFSDSCYVTVTAVQAQSIIVNKSFVQAKIGEQVLDIVATVLPINASNKDVEWKSSNENIVSIIDNSGLHAVGTGTAVVTISMVNNPSVFAQIQVSVVAPTVDKMPLVYKTAYAQSYLDNLYVQNLIGTNTGQYSPEKANGVQSAIDNAMIEINNAQATEISVQAALLALDIALQELQNSKIGMIAVASIDIIRKEIVFVKGESKQVFAYILPINATNTELQWVISHSAIAQVSQLGMVTALKSGETYVYAYAKDGSGMYDSCKIIVKNPLQTILLPQTISLVEQESHLFNMELFPADADVVGFKWMSDDNAVAQIDANGTVSAVSEGITTISVTETLSGKSASVVVMVQKQEVPVSGIDIKRDSIVVTVGNSVMVYPTIQPIHATNQQYTWNSSNQGVALVNNSGMVSTLNIGVSMVRATTVQGGFYDEVKIIVVPSFAPIVQTIPEIVLETGSSPIVLNLPDYVSDDNTQIADLLISSVSSENFIVVIENGQIIITPIHENMPVSEILEVVVTDADNQSVSLFIPVEISGIPNTPPVFVHTELAVSMFEGGNFAPLYIYDLVKDDYTKTEQLTFEIVNLSDYLHAFISQGILQVSRNSSDWVGKDSVLLVVTDAGGLSTEKYVFYEVSQKPNEAPIISAIPEQVYNSSTKKYPLLYLRNFVKDDYTLPSYIEWTYEPHAKLSINIINGIATVSTADPNWTGTAVVKFKAYDADGLYDSTLVMFTQKSQSGTTWGAKPKIAYSALQTTVGVGQPVQFTSSMSGADTWIWEFEGLQLPAQQRILPNPTVAYTKGGKYKVVLKAQNTYGIDSLVKEAYITVIGIDNVNEIACIGIPVTLQSTVPASLGYTFEWSNGATTESILVSPKNSTTYSLIVKKGLFEYEDEVSLIVPDTLLLPQDKSLCQGDNFEINVPGFAEYNWNNQGWTQEDLRVVSSVGSTHLRVRDQYGCESTDEFSIIQLYPLPQFDLGVDTAICSGTSISLKVSLDNMEYQWSTSETTQAIEVSQAAMYSVVVTDANNCSTMDSKKVDVLTPHKEDLGVATFAKDGNGVIVAWERSLGKRTATYLVQRELGETNSFETIATVPFNTNESFILDDNANVKTKAYTYRIVTIDSTCNNKAYSDPHTTIHVINNINLSGHANLQWNAYIGLPILSYKILKGTNASNMVEVDAVAGNKTTWTDPVSFQYGTLYRVEMKLPDTVETRWPLLKAESGPFSLALSNIAEAGTDIEQVVGNKVLVYPTMSHDFITVEFEYALENITVSLLSQNGSVVYVSPYNNGKKVQVPVHMLSQGIYTVKVQSVEKIVTSTIIVK